MEQRIIESLARYEARWAEEQRLQQELPRDEAYARVDEFLLPIGPETGALLNELAKSLNARTILEVGSSYGYSTIWLAEAARATGGKVISLELSNDKINFATNALSEIGLRAYVEFVAGDALASIGTLAGPFDLVLIDLWKDLYIPSFDLIYPKLSRGAMIAADNIVYPPENAANAAAYRAHIRTFPEIESVLLPIGAGVELTRYAAAG